MFDAAQMTMRRERPVEPRCARGCRGVTLVSGLPGSPAARCPARDRAPRRGSSRLPGSNRRRCHRRIEQHLPTGAIAQEAYRKYTLTDRAEAMLRSTQHDPYAEFGRAIIAPQRSPNIEAQRTRNCCNQAITLRTGL